MRDKFTVMSLAVCLLVEIPSKAQFTTEGAGCIVQANATIHVDGLSLTPTATLDLSDKTFYHYEESVSGKPHSSINRFHRIYLPIVFTGKVGMRYQATELNGNQEADLQLSFIDPKTYKFSIPTNKTVVDVNTNYLEEDVVNLELYDITAVSSGSVLPVKLINFTAMANEKHVLIAWTTSEETNSDYFEVQHSVDGKEWKAIGRVEASGESDVDKTYSYEHNGPLPGENLYRLKMMDQDGTFAYSRIRIVKMDVESVFSFHPNPVSDLLKIDVADWSSLKNIKVSNASGLTVAELNELQITNLSEKAINVRKFPSGMYLIQVTHKDGTVKNGKVFKN
jgi:hypothetical protein